MNKKNSTQRPNHNKSTNLKKVQSKHESKSKDIKGKKVFDENGVLVETARKVETGARIIGDKTVEVVEKVSDQTTQIVEITYDKLKKGVSDAYDKSSKTMGGMSKKAGKYIKKYEDTIEMKKLSHERNAKMQELGEHIFTLSKSKSQDIDELLNNEDSRKKLSELEILNKEVVKLGRRIKRKI
jgi:hypothetical protein